MTRIDGPARSIHGSDSLRACSPSRAFAATEGRSQFFLDLGRTKGQRHASLNELLSARSQLSKSMAPCSTARIRTSDEETLVHEPEAIHQDLAYRRAIHLGNDSDPGPRRRTVTLGGQNQLEKSPIDVLLARQCCRMSTTTTPKSQRL